MSHTQCNTQAIDEHYSALLLLNKSKSTKSNMQLNEDGSVPLDTRIRQYLADETNGRYLRPPQVGPLAAGLGGFGETQIAANAEETAWVADKELGYALATITKKTATFNTCTYYVNKDKMRVDVKPEDCHEVNPSAFDFCEDMASLTHLNEASVLFNLKERFRLDLIHTYSGLFCVTVNPWRWLPVYSNELVQLYRGHADNRPPHIYSVANTAYTNVIEGSGNQSILITGESGAGKTENTKKIIQYFTIVAGHRGSEGEASLEDQIIEMNPVLEAFGNAKTVKNDNSSRFGKFIRIRFGEDGKINGADVESYLLEKSRVVSQNSGERNFHIFYQLMSSGMPKDKREQLKLEGNVDDFRFTNQGGMSKVAGMDDAKEVVHTNHGMKLLGFEPADMSAIYQLVAAVAWIGQIKFRQQDACEQTFVEGYTEADIACELLGLNRSKFINSITDPTFQVGEETVMKYLNYQQSMFAISAVSKVIYDRIFKFIVDRCNKCLNARHEGQQKEIETGAQPSMFRRGKRKGDSYIGVLDISGFEIMEVNSFEQLCINFTNEKLQQFFNHFMFVSEQQEYENEGIEWDHIDFGMDLAACISLIEKPLGILSMLEEEGMVPNGSDAQFVTKLIDTHNEKTDKFLKPKISRKTQHRADFAIAHYAGVVAYTVDGWLDKNKDPLNECVLDLLRKSKNDLLRKFFAGDAPPVSNGARKNERKMSIRPGKSSALATTSTIYKSQLSNLLDALHVTKPHFVRCIVPNFDKEPGYIDGPLVLHQLKCNGVLEGIRICRRGYPNRLLFLDFCDRYQIFDTAIYKKLIQSDPKACCKGLCAAMGLEPVVEFQLGLSKIFCRVGVIGKLESRRMKQISLMLTGLQAHIRAVHAQKDCTQRVLVIKSNVLIQKNIRLVVANYNWEWNKALRLTKGIHLSEEDYDLAMEALMAACEGDGGSWIDGQWVFGNTVDGVFRDRNNKERKSTGKVGRGVPNEEFEKLQTENLELRHEVEQLESKIAAILTTSEQQEKQMGVLKKELRQNEEQVSEMQVNLQLQEDNIKDLSETVTVEQHQVKQLESSNDELKDDLKRVKETMERERKAREDLEFTQNSVSDQLKRVQSELQDSLTVKKKLEQTASNKEAEAKHFANQLREQESMTERVTASLKEIKNEMNDLMERLNTEKMARKKVEQQKEKLSDTNEHLKGEVRDGERTVNQQRDQLRKKDSELERLTKAMEEAKRMYENALNEMNSRHKRTVSQLQTDKESIQRDNIKLDMENKQLKGQLEAERASNVASDRGYESDLGSRRKTRNLRSYSMQIDRFNPPLGSYMNGHDSAKSAGSLLNRRIDELERENKEIDRDKRLLKRELEKTMRELKEETDEREAAIKQLRESRFDMDRLNQALSREEERNSDVERHLHRAQADNSQLKAKFENMALEKQAELDKEKELMKQKLLRATQEERSKRAHLNSVERSQTDLLHDLSELNMELERAYHTIDSLEKLQKTQDKALDQWGYHYRMTSTELDALREENAQLRAKLRLQQKDVDSMKESCRDSGLSVTDRASELETEIKHLRNEIESSVSTSRHTLEQNGDSGSGSRRSESPPSVSFSIPAPASVMSSTSIRSYAANTTSTFNRYVRRSSSRHRISQYRSSLD